MGHFQVSFTEHSYRRGTVPELDLHSSVNVKLPSQRNTQTKRGIKEESFPSQLTETLIDTN